MAPLQAPEWSSRENPGAQDDHAYQKRVGRLEGIVRPQGDRYWFSVRDMTREESTIHGFGVDFDEAVTAVEQLMALLNEDQRRHPEAGEEAGVARRATE